MSVTLFRGSLTAAFFLASLVPCGADPAPVIHYAPTENLEHIDVELIDGARHASAHAGRRAKEAGSFFVVSCRGHMAIARKPRRVMRPPLSYLTCSKWVSAASA